VTGQPFIAMDERPRELDALGEMRLRRVAAKPPSKLIVVIIALFVGSVLALLGAILPILWTAIDIALRPRLSYGACNSLEERSARLACYDQLARQQSRVAKGARPGAGANSPAGLTLGTK
jgi:hypothetical protein